MRDRANFFLITLIFVFLISTLATASANEIVVDSNSNGDFGSIQEAVSNAFPGDTVIVRSGTYKEHVLVNVTGLTIRPESKNDVLVESLNENESVFLVKVDNVSISDFRVIGSGEALNSLCGICLEDVNNCTIKGNNFVGNFPGVSILNSSSNKISENTFINNVTSPGDGSSNAIYLGDYCGKNSLMGNIIENGYITLGSGSSENIISGNEISNGGGIIFACCGRDNIISGNTIFNCSSGIDVYDQKVQISKNRIKDCFFGIDLSFAGGTGIHNNMISNCSIGVNLREGCSGIELSDNLIISSAEYGIFVPDYEGNEKIYNNYFNNTQNVRLGISGGNIWNISRTPGINIVGDPYIGGNFWAKPDRTGFSQISADSDMDGIGDLRYNISGTEFDYLPLVSLSSPEKPVFPVSNESGMNSSFDRIIVKGPSDLPVADFNANPTSGNAPLTVQFIDLSQNVTGKNWSFGDGNTSTEANPSYTYYEAGNYTVNLTVSNENHTNSKTLEITVHEVPVEEKVLPAADFSATPVSGNAPLSVQFTDLSKNATGWNWDFDDGNTSTDQSPEHTYSKAGNYIVNLTASNANGTNSKTLEITVLEALIEEKILPTADFIAIPTSGNAPLSVQFIDLSKNATGRNWNFEDGNTSTEANPSHTYFEAGNYIVNLTVSNANGTDSDTLEIIVHETPIEEIAPVADFVAYPASGNAPLSVQFTDHSQNALARSWDFNNDGFSDSIEINPVHVYNAPGNYFVNLTVSNEIGTSWKILEITVHEAPIEEKALPAADFIAIPVSGNAPLSVQFTDLSKNATGRNWNFDDGNTSTDQNPVHTYSKAGIYTVTLTAINENGTNSKTLEITVYEIPIEEKILPVANFTAYPTSGNAPLSVQFTDLSQNAVSRSWDFNNDRIEDSNNINPVYTYPVPGEYTVNLAVNNSNGTANKTASINVLDGSSSGGSSSHSSSSGGGGGGGGAGGSPELQSNVDIKELSQSFVASGSSIRFDFPRNATSVLYITFNSKKTAGKTTTIVEMLKGKSTLVSQLPSGEVYKFLNIWVGNSGFATSNNIENPVVCFKIDKSWMRDKEVIQSSITLERYSDNKWNSLPTSLLGEDSNYLYFTAKTPGFSPFAITGDSNAKKTVSKTQPAADTKIQPGANTGNPVQSSAVSETVQRSQPTSEQKSATEKNSSLPIFGMICMIALLLVAFLIKIDKKP